MFLKKVFKRREREVDILQQKIDTLTRENNILHYEKSRIDYHKIIESIIGTPLFFDKNDPDGKPPHYLEDEEDRRIALARISLLYQDKYLQKAFAYTINVLANHAIFKSSEDNMKNARYAILGVQALMQELKELHIEYIDSQKQNDFDPLQILPD